MVSPSASSKRRLSTSDARVSPPPIKRKLQSGTTKTAVANFFTPSSQKPKDKTVWAERAVDKDSVPTLLVGRYEPDVPEENPPKRRKVAAFDLDSTLIAPASGKKHADGAGDWKWWHLSVPGKLRDMYKEGYRIVILTNQGGLTLHLDPKAKGPKPPKNRVPDFKQKCSSVLTQLDVPLTLYAATGKDIFRKPRTGMWEELRKDYNLSDVDLANSIFVGDAGGRVALVKGKPTGAKAEPKDFSCSDRNLADNLGIAYKTPEEFFLEQAPRAWVRDFDPAKFPPELLSDDVISFKKLNSVEVVLFCGPPGAGKSTFFEKRLKPLGYMRINQDMLKTRQKCIETATENLKRGLSVAIDNTNPDHETRKLWIDLAQGLGKSIRCVWFKTPLQVAEHNNAVRALNGSLNPESRELLPKLAFVSFTSRFKEPKLKEGFQDITEVEFKFRGTAEEYAIWSKYWL